ncbi:hypothetical protein L3Q82_012694, partial [Scortum barcoo]
YHLVKLLEKFGNVKQFDFLFHKSGPLEGQPRGYCFVNFNTREEAERAIQCLNGKLALSKKLVVRWAHAQVRVSVKLGSIFRKLVFIDSISKVTCRDKGSKVSSNDKTMPPSLEPSCSKPWCDRGRSRSRQPPQFHHLNESFPAIFPHGTTAGAEICPSPTLKFPPLPLAANVSLSLSLSLFFFYPSSTSAKIRAIEAKLQMMEENPDDDYSGPSWRAYVYNKPPERKRWEPYSKSHHNNQSRPFRKFRR